MPPRAEAAAEACVLARRRRLPEASASGAARFGRAAGGMRGSEPPMLLAAEQLLPISDRQREIGRMAAQGLSTREIADRLGVSVRTVEGHIYHACTKLGVANRTEPARMLGHPWAGKDE